jgi:gliding motility-associated-like protein
MKNKFTSLLLFSGVFLFGIHTLQAQISSGNPLPERIMDDCIPFIANAFTPNGDNRNDKFGILINEDCDVVDFNMRIIDRWGRKVFDVDNHTESFWWDGTFDGTELPNGIYVYQITARFNPPSGGETQLISRQGTIALIR